MNENVALLRGLGVSFQEKIDRVTKRIPNIHSRELLAIAGSELSLCRGVFDNLSNAVQVVQRCDDFLQVSGVGSMRQVMQHFLKGNDVQLVATSLMETVNTNVSRCIARLDYVLERIDKEEQNDAPKN